MGNRGQAQRKAIKAFASVAESSSHWLWVDRRETVWIAKGQLGSHYVTHILVSSTFRGPALLKAEEQKHLCHDFDIRAVQQSSQIHEPQHVWMPSVV